MNIIQILTLKLVGLHKDYVDMCNQNTDMKLMAMKEHEELLNLRTSIDYWKGLQAQTAKERDAALNRASEYRNSVDLLTEENKDNSHTIGILNDQIKILQSDLDKMTVSRDELSVQYHNELDANKELTARNIDLLKLKDVLLHKVEKTELQLAEVGEEKQKLAMMLVEEQKRFAKSKSERLHQRDVIAKLQQQIKSESDE